MENSITRRYRSKVLAQSCLAHSEYLINNSEQYRYMFQKNIQCNKIFESICIKYSWPLSDAGLNYVNLLIHNFFKLIHILLQTHIVQVSSSNWESMYAEGKLQLQVIFNCVGYCHCSSINYLFVCVCLYILVQIRIYIFT